MSVMSIQPADSHFAQSFVVKTPSTEVFIANHKSPQKDKHHQQLVVVAR